MFVIQLCFGSVIQLYHFGIVEKQKGHLLWTRTCVQCCGPELFVSQLTLQTKKFRPRLKPIAGPVMTARIGTRWANLATKPESPAAKPVGFWAVWKSDVCSLRQTSDQASTVSRSSRTTFFKRGCFKRWAETNFQNHPLTKHISTLNQLRVLLDLSPNRWIAHPRSAQNAVSCGMYLDLVPNDKKVGNKNLHHLQRKGCFCTGILQLTKSSSRKTFGSMCLNKAL